MTNDKYIVKNLILAQICSDGGKNYYSDLADISLGNLFNKKGYNAKDACILKAIHTILKSKNSDFRFYVQKDYYSNNLQKWCYIVYFNYLPQRNIQISFHSFSRKLENYINDICITRWRKVISSRESCRLLKRWYYL